MECVVGVDELRLFAEQGYLVLPDVVPEALLHAAEEEVERVTASLAPVQAQEGPGTRFWFLTPAQLPRAEEALISSGGLSLAEALVAPNRLELAFDHIQVATTVPPWSHVPGGPHIDGHRPDQDAPGSFTLLAGIFLTNQATSACGNLWVWPGSHLVHERVFQERGAGCLLPTSGHLNLLEAAPPLGPAVEVLARRGDLLLSHFLLGHNSGGNTSESIRRTLYFRLSTPSHAREWEATFLDCWHEFPPIRRGTGR